MCTGMLCYPERVVLCVPVYCVTQCMVPVILESIATYFEAPALYVRLSCATAVLPLCMNVSYYVYQYTVVPIA